jgi:lipid A disaccharide synthetase
MNSQRPLRIFFSAGEPSGDLHGANLIRRLKEIGPGVEAVGYGGPEMALAGCRLHTDLTALAVMWLLRALLNIHKFWRLVQMAKKYFHDEKPDAVVLIDYPGFNWWIARKAKQAGIPVFYYTPPQIWAWASWRVKKMRKFVDHVLCSLPFEELWFCQRGCNATFVGHPFFDEVRRHEMDAEFLCLLGQRPSRSPSPGHRPGEMDSIEGISSAQRANNSAKDWPIGPTENHDSPYPPGRCPGLGEPRSFGANKTTSVTKPSNAPHPNHLPKGEGMPLVAILPGSRTQEVTKNVPWFLKAAALVHEKVPGARFAMACFKQHHAELVRAKVEAAGLPISIHVGKTPEIMKAADCAMAVSGSVSLELLYYLTPTVILYWIPRYAYIVQVFFRKVKYITLVNLLATKELYPEDLTPYDPGQPDAEAIPFPEYLTCEDKSEQIAAHVVEWLTHPDRLATKTAQLEALKTRIAHGGASRRAAEYIVKTLRKKKTALPRPHFLGSGVLESQ